MTADAERLADECEKLAWDEYVREHGYSTYPVEPDTGADFSAGFRAGLASVAAERDAEKERADKAEAMLRLANRNTVRRGAERDALRARIEAVKAIVNRDLAGSVARSLNAALAGDQSEAAQS